MLKQRKSKYRWLLLPIFITVLVWVGCSNQPVNPASEQNQATVEPSSEIEKASNRRDAGIQKDADNQEFVPEASSTEKDDYSEKTPEVKPDKNYPPTKPFPKLEGGQILEDKNPDPDVVEVHLEAIPKKIKLTDKITATMYTYNGIIPGPIIRARVGNKVIVHFTNKLPEATTVHWHGLRIPDNMDGSPRVQKPVQPGETFTYTFTLKDAGSYWYHPHVRSHEQVEKGLYGMFVIQEKENIAFTRERAFVLDDILLTATGLAPFLKSHPEIMHGRNGNQLFMNGQIEKQSFKVKAGDLERWRLVNVSNARTMDIQLQGFDVQVIGTDGGLINKPYVFQRLDVAVGQRFDLEVKFNKTGTFKVALMVRTTKGLQAITFAEVTVEGTPPQSPTKSPKYPKIEPLPSRKVDAKKLITFGAVRDNNSPGGIAWQMNGKSHWKEFMYTFKQGMTVQFTLKNLAGPEHPFHLHGQFFQVISRNGNKAYEPGLKDTVLVKGMETVEIIAYMDNPGRWMAHCHILEHAELGMMAEFKVEASK